VHLGELGVNLDLSEENNLLVSMVEKLLVGAGGVDRLRKLQPGTVDRELYVQLAEMGILTMRSLPTDQGGSPLFDTMLAMEQAGRHLPRLPLAEAIVAAGLLGRSQAHAAEGWLARIGSGEVVVTLALHDCADRPDQLVAFGGACDAVVFRKDSGLYLQEGSLSPVSADHGDQALGRFATTGAPVVELAQGEEAVALFVAAIEEWKLLISAELWGLWPCSKWPRAMPTNATSSTARSAASRPSRTRWRTVRSTTRRPVCWVGGRRGYSAKAARRPPPRSA
jgi:hypothetical protein